MLLKSMHKNGIIHLSIKPLNIQRFYCRGSLMVPHKHDGRQFKWVTRNHLCSITVIIAILNIRKLIWLELTCLNKRHVFLVFHEAKQRHKFYGWPQSVVWPHTSQAMSEADLHSTSPVVCLVTQCRLPFLNCLSADIIKPLLHWFENFMSVDTLKKFVSWKGWL